MYLATKSTDKIRNGASNVLCVGRDYPEYGQIPSPIKNFASYVTFEFDNIKAKLEALMEG